MTMHANHEHKTSEARARRFLTAYILFVVGVSSLLFIFNMGIVYSLTRGIEAEFSELFGITGVVQFLLFVLPVALVFAEWYLWDILFAKRYRS
ncbi:hypothetical protein SH449x_000301 [Pirellulaceae bacterium SH449]